MYTCGACSNKHASAEQAKICYGLIRPTPAAPPAAPVRPAPPTATDSQVSYLKTLFTERDWSQATGRFAGLENSTDAGLHSMTKTDASAAITYAQGLRRKPKDDATGSIIMPEFLKMIPDGYYAARLDESNPIKFFRVSNPKKGEYAGAVKVQQGFGTGYGSKLRYEITHVLWPSGRMSVYDKRIEGELTVVMADYRSAAHLFSISIGRCCRCFAELSDARSRHFGIGPECETYWQWKIQQVNEDDMAKGELPWDLRPAHERV